MRRDLVELLQKSWATGLVAFVVAALFAPLIKSFLLKLGSRQTVSEHVPEHAAKQGTPTMGGLIVVVGVVAAFITQGQVKNNFTLYLFLWFAMIGFLDDFVVPRSGGGKRGLGWLPKLGLQIVPFIALFALAPTTPLWIIGLMAFVVLFFANAFNFSDGMDGLAGGIGGILAFTLFACPFLVLMLNPGANVDTSLLPILFALGLAIIPFLYMNAPPAKMFMGDVGSLPIGALLGMGFLQSTVFRDPYEPSLERMVPFIPCLLVLIAELVPVPLQIGSAKLRKGKRLFPFRTPIHHGFQAAGWPETRVVSVFLLTQLLLALATVALTLGLLDTSGFRLSGGP